MGVAVVLSLAILGLAGGWAVAGAAPPSPHALPGTSLLSGVACPSENGMPYSGSPRNIVLGDHTLVQLDIGRPLVPPQPFEFNADTP